MTNTNNSILHNNFTMATFNNSSSITQQHPRVMVDVEAHFTYVDIVSLVVLGMLICCIIGGNVLVISAFVTVGRKIKTITNYFVVSLAASDILVGVFSIPFWMMVQLNYFQPSSIPFIIFVAFDIMLGVASIVNLTIISLERLFAVIRPATHRNLSRQTHLVFCTLFAVWVFAFVNSGLYFLKEFNNWIGYDVYIVIIGFVIPALVIVGSYVAIYKVAQNHISEQKKVRQEMRLAGMIAIVIALFVICWLPFFLINVLFTYCHKPECDIVVMEKSIPFVKFLHYSNSMMNPLIYAYRNSDYRQAFKNLLFTMLRRKKMKKRSASGLSSMTGRSELDDNNLVDSTQCLRSLRGDSILSAQ